MEGRFSVIRYVPDPVRNEPVNVGVIVQCGEEIQVRVHKEALKRAISSDPQADESAIDRTESFINGLVEQDVVVSDPDSGSILTLHPIDQGYLQALASQDAGKLLLSSPRFVEVRSQDIEDMKGTLDMLVIRLARPLRQRSIFAPIESPPRREIRRALKPWIDAKNVETGHPLPSLSGLQRQADFYFKNGQAYFLNHIALDYKRESQLFKQAEAAAFEIEDVRKGDPSTDWVPVVICEFAPDRAEESVWQVKSVFGVVDCAAFDASSELDKTIEFAKDHLPKLS